MEKIEKKKLDRILLILSDVFGYWVEDHKNIDNGCYGLTIEEVEEAEKYIERKLKSI